MLFDWKPRATHWWHTKELGPPFARTGQHIRGRVFACGETWFFEVVNTHTGEVIASDNTNDRLTILDACNNVVAAARGAWSYEFTRKALR